MSQQKIDVNAHFAFVARSIAPLVIMQKIPLSELSLPDEYCTMDRYNDTTVVHLHYQTKEGESLELHLLFVRDELQWQLPQGSSVDEQNAAEFEHWFVAEVSIEGVLPLMLEMTPEERALGLPELQDLYDWRPWEGMPPTDDGLLVHSRLVEVHRRLLMLQSFGRFLSPETEEEASE